MILILYWIWFRSFPMRILGPDPYQTDMDPHSWIFVLTFPYFSTTAWSSIFSRCLIQGCIKYQQLDILLHPQFFESWLSSQKFPSSSPLNILPNSLNIIEKMILLSLSPFSKLYSFPLSSPLHNLIFFPKRLDTPPPPRGDKELYTSLAWTPSTPGSHRSEAQWLTIKEIKSIPTVQTTE